MTSPYRYTSVQANYLTIPVYVFAFFMLAAGSWTSDHYKKRALVACAGPLLVILGYAIVLGTTNIGASYFAMFMCAGGKFMRQRE